MMNMEGAFLEEVGAVTKAENLRKKEIQLNTRMHYTQRRLPSNTLLPIPWHLLHPVNVTYTVHETAKSSENAQNRSHPSLVKLHSS